MAQWHRDVLKRWWGRTLGASCVGAVICLGACPLHAQPPPPPADEFSVVILPTLTPTGELPSPIELRRPKLADGTLWNKARELDLLLRDTMQDLGFVVNLSGIADASASNYSERALIEQANRSDHWLLSPRLEYEGNRVVMRLVLVPSGAGHAIVRTEATTPDEFQVRAVVMVRDLVQAGLGQPIVTASPKDISPIGTLESPRSEGRAVLAMHAAALGGFVGYSLQKSGGSDDARLTYPLMALGAGVGLGGSLIIAEEWDVGLGDAWYMSAGTVWPAFGGLMLAAAQDVQPESDRYAWGIGGGLAGITLASISLSFRGMGTGGAAVAHSGGFIGTGLGAGTEMAIRGKTDFTPHRGLAYGSLGGVLLGGIIGRSIEESPSRVMMIDMGVGLGALSFAALGSPLLIGDTTETRERAWVLVTMTGAIAGGAAAYWITAPGGSDSISLLPLSGHPIAGVIGQSYQADGSVVPAYGVGWSGAF